MNMFGAPPLMYWHSRQWHCALSRGRPRPHSALVHNSIRPRTSFVVLLTADSSHPRLSLSPLARQCDKIAARFRPHADLPSRSLDHRPHRRGRGDRAAGRGDQGTGRERARRRREIDRGHDRSRRATADPGRRRRAWAGRSRSRARRRAARDVETPRRRSHADRDLRLPRRGAALDRLGVAARDPHPRAGAPMGSGFWSRTGSRARSSLAPAPPGARVEARDLFAATPARLKFLKSDRAEALAAADAVKRLAMAAPEVRFSFTTDLGSSFDWPAAGAGDAGFAERLRQALGDDFASNSVALDARREALRLSGRVGLPTYSRPNASQQFLFVNGRAVRDKTLAGALRGAYLDFLPPDRHAVAALFVECDPTRGRRQRPPRESRSALSRRGRRPRPHRRRDQAAPERGAASRLDHRRHGDDPRHASAATLPRRVLFSALGLARLARRAAARRARAGELRRTRALGAGAGGVAERARPRRSAWRGAGAGARELHHRPDAGRHRHRRPARGA